MNLCLIVFMIKGVIQELDYNPVIFLSRSIENPSIKKYWVKLDFKSLLVKPCGHQQGGMGMQKDHIMGSWGVWLGSKFFYEVYLHPLTRVRE